MDKISLAGLAIGLVAIIGGQILEGGHIGSLVQPTALLIVCGGTLGAVLLQSPLHIFTRGVKMAKWVWVPPVIEQKRQIEQILAWSQLSRREGLLALKTIFQPSRMISPERACSYLSTGQTRSGYVSCWRLR